MRYAQQRESFGRPIAQHQAVQFMLADMATAVHAARTCTMQAATLKDDGQPYINEASIAKLIASEMCVDVTSKAVQVHGGYGYFKDSPVERLFRDARGYYHLRRHLGSPAAANCPSDPGPVSGIVTGAGLKTRPWTLPTTPTELPRYCQENGLERCPGLYR